MGESERWFINRSIKAACTLRPSGCPSVERAGCHRESLPVYTRRGYLSWRSLPRRSSFLHSRDTRPERWNGRENIDRSIANRMTMLKLLSAVDDALIFLPLSLLLCQRVAAAALIVSIPLVSKTRRSRDSLRVLFEISETTRIGERESNDNRAVIGDSRMCKIYNISDDHDFCR